MREEWIGMDWNGQERNGKERIGKVREPKGSLLKESKYFKQKKKRIF